MIKDYLLDAYRKFKNSSNINSELLSGIEQRKKEEIWIVFAGKTHVGKSTLINVLFNPKEKLKEGNGSPGTKKPFTDKIALELTNERGNLIYTDLPGFGADLKSKQYNEQTNLDYFEKCDLIVWLFKCDDTAKELEQIFYNKLKPKIKKKIVFGLSQVDKASGNWYNKGLKPSKKQLIYIMRRITDISAHFDIPKDKIIDFSTHKNYNIDKLAKHLILSIKGKGDVLRHKIALEQITDSSNQLYSKNIKG